MGNSREAARLASLVGVEVTAAVVADRPRAFARTRSSRFSDGIEVAVDGLPPGLATYEGELDEDDRDPGIDAALDAGVVIGATATDLIVARRSVIGRAASVVRSDPLERVTLRWFDDEVDAMQARYLHLEFPGGRWAMLATPWRRLIPADADAIVATLGDRAHRITTLALPDA